MTQVVEAYNAKELSDISIELRPIEKEECARWGLDPQKVMRQSIAESAEAIAVFVEGELAAIWGYRTDSFMSGIAMIWLYASPLAERYPYRFAANMIRATRYVNGHFPIVKTLAAKDHPKAVRLLMKCGFTVTGNLDLHDRTYLMMELSRHKQKETRH